MRASFVVISLVCCSFAICVGVFVLVSSSFRWMSGWVYRLDMIGGWVWRVVYVGGWDVSKECVIYSVSQHVHITKFD